jgi:polysaccharide chain length determinant protein (PEP-CTERM system associated)
MTQRQLKFDDYLQILAKSKWLLIIPTLVAALGGFLATYAFPPEYTSQALLLVVRQQIPEGLVKSIVTQEMVERLATLGGRIQSRDHLLPIAQRAGLLDGGKNPRSTEEVLGTMRSNIALTPVSSDMIPTLVAQRSSTVPGLYISYTGRDPRIAQQVCSDLTSAFIEENLKLRGQIAQGTTDFFNSQLDQFKRDQDALESKLANFRSKYFTQLPDHQEQNLKMLASLNSQLDATTQALGRAEQDKAYAESMLNQQMAAWKASLTAYNPQTLHQQLATLQAQLLSLQARYTPEYPEIITVQKHIAELEAQINNPPPAGPTSNSGDKTNAMEPAELQRLRAQVHEYQESIQQISGQQARFEQQIQAYQSRVEVSPEVEEQYAQLTRDYAAAQKAYSDLAAKQHESELESDMERRQQGEQFHLSDPASLPLSPSFPNPLLFVAGGLGAGAFLGLAIVFGLEMRDQTIHNERDVLATLQLATFSAIPWMADTTNGHTDKARVVKTMTG